MNTRRLLLLFCPGFGFCIQLHATILNVPAQYPTIQAAMQAAVDGDTVLVAPGTYYGPVYFRGKKVVLASQYLLTNNISYIHSTIIDGSTPPNPDSSSCVFIVNNEDTNAVLVGFTLTRGKGTKWLDEHGAGLYREGGGILTQYSSPKIMHNIIVDNEAINASGVTSAGGGAIRVGDGNPRIINNIIMDNRGRYGAGIVLNYTGAIVKNNIIARNNGGQDFGGSGIWIYANGPAAKLVENNTIVGNSSSLDGGGVLVWNTSATLKNNIIWGNTAPQGPQIRLRPGGSVTVSYCDVQDGWTGTGNINVDPQFRDTSHYLQATSQCVDAGDTSAQYNDPEDPLDPGRALYPSLGGLRNDIGAYGGPLRSLLGQVLTADRRHRLPIEPGTFSLAQNYPNPFNSWTTFEFVLPHSAEVSLRILNMLGEDVETLAKGRLRPGLYRYRWDASGSPSGTYLVTLESGGRSESRKVMVLK